MTLVPLRDKLQLERRTFDDPILLTLSGKLIRCQVPELWGRPWMEQNKTHFNAAREKLEQWADDMVRSAEKVLLDTKEQIKALRRRARQAIALAEQHEIQEKIWKLERQQRRQRQEIFRVEDEIIEKRDQLIDSLERKIVQQIETETPFTIRLMVK